MHRRTTLALAAALLALGPPVLSAAPPPVAPTPSELPPAFRKPAPEGPADLRAIQGQIRKVVEKVSPAVVGLVIGNSAGSGVVVSPDGYVLTAAHVIGKSGETVVILFPDGTRLKGKSLGLNTDLDSGLVKIDAGDRTLAYAELGDSSAMEQGDWCVAVGHPGGYRPGRSPVVRLGRVQNTDSTVLRSDCTLVGGDSGGPLFDAHGRVVGIHSRIGVFITNNLHVPVNTFRDTWSRLDAAEEWGQMAERESGRNKPKVSGPAWFGVKLDPDEPRPTIQSLSPGGPAEKAGLKTGDVILRVAGEEVDSIEQVLERMKRQSPGSTVMIEVSRDDENRTIRVVVGKMPPAPPKK